MSKSKTVRLGLTLAALTAAGALVLTACSSSGEPSSSETSKSGNSAAPIVYGDNYVTINGSEPQNPLLPTNTNETGGAHLINNLFSGLVHHDASGEAKNDLAESFEVNDDNTLWTITIKKGRKFNDGTPVTAQSFVDSWNFGANAKNAQLGQSFFSMIEGYSEETESDLTGLTVVDDRTFTVKLTSPDAQFPTKTGYYVYFPMPAVAFEDLEAFGQYPVGNGPYILKDENAWKHNVEATLIPNPDYQGEFKPKNDGLVFKFYESLTSAYADLLSDNLDVLDTVPTESLEVYQADLGDRVIEATTARNNTFTIPQSLEHFSGEEGKLRRQAISMAFNREEITQVIFNGTRTPAHDFTSPALPGFDPKLKGNEVLEYNAAEAKKLWEKADKIAPWTGTFEIAYNADGGHQEWVDAVCNGIKNTLGIQAQGKPYATFKELRNDVVNRNITTAFRTGWVADYPLLSSFLTDLYSTGAGSNDGDYSNAKFDKLMTQAAGQTDDEKFFEDLNKGQEILLQDLPVIPLWYQQMVGGHSTKIESVTLAWDGKPDYTEIIKK